MNNKINLELVKSKDGERLLIRDKDSKGELFYRTPIIEYDFSGNKRQAVDIEILKDLQSFIEDKSCNINLNVKDWY